MSFPSTLSVLIVDDETLARVRLRDLLADIAAEVPNEVIGEAANGELGFFIVSDGTGNPYKIKVRPPCFTQYAAFHEIIEGGMISDAVISLSSINIIAGELDR